MSDHNSTISPSEARHSKPGFRQRAAQNLAAVKTATFDAVPPPVVERMSGEAKLGAGLIVLGALMGTGIVYLVFTSKGGDWKLLAVLSVIPGFISLVGANLISRKIVKQVAGSIAAIIQALRGKSPTNGNGSEGA